MGYAALQDASSFQSMAGFWEVHGDLTITSILLTACFVVFLVMSRYRHKANNKTLQELNEALLVAQQKTEESDRLKTSILRNMSHEVRTPLNAIMGYADLIAAGEGDAAEMAERIAASGSRLKQTFQMLMEMAALEGGVVSINRQSFNLVKAVRETIDVLDAVADAKAVKMHTTFASEEITITSDAEAVKRALKPVLQNALQYTEAGEINIAVKPEQTEVLIVVRDTGIGMDPAFIARACEPFIQESTGFGRKFEGIGLGLSVANRMVELLDGRLTIESSPARGSTVTIRLPRTV